jgi:small subunit ribosomal protein S20
MANTDSAKKRIRQIARRTDVNRARMGRVRTYMRSVEEAIASGDKVGAEAAFKVMQPELMRGARRGLVHRNLVARKLSRLSKRIKGLGA